MAWHMAPDRLKLLPAPVGPTCLCCLLEPKRCPARMIRPRSSLGNQGNAAAEAATFVCLHYNLKAKA